MSNEDDLVQGILGPEASDVLRQTVDRHGDLMSEEEKRMVEEYTASPQEASEDVHAGICSLLTDIADDFQSRRRALLLAQRLEAMRKTDDDDGDGDELGVPDEDGNLPPADPGSLLDDLDL